jgi:hypothetical protein
VSQSRTASRTTCPGSSGTSFGEVAHHLEQQRAVLVGVVVGGDRLDLAGRLVVEEVGDLEVERGDDVDDVATGVAVQQDLAVPVGD